MMETEGKQASKRQRFARSPRSFVTWNCTGFVSRCKWNASDITKLLEETSFPDLICIQEARLKAFNQHNRGKPLFSEYKEVKDVVETILKDYEPIWSLADTRYAGTVTFVRKELCFDAKKRCAFTVDAAIELILKQNFLTREKVGLQEKKKTQKLKEVAKQTDIKSFFTVKTNTNDSTVPSEHHPEGRFQFLAFEDIDVIQTYVPNNGTNEESFQRRREWDESVLQFLSDRQRILEHCRLEERPLLWCGDFNCARDHRDGTHWEKREDGTIHEFWTDPERCFVGAKGSTDLPSDPDNAGIPSFTPAERKRFAQILHRGGFADVWRELHAEGTNESTNLTKWSKPDYTWRGHLAKSGSNYNAKFQGKGQRLDYFLLTPVKLVGKGVSCNILGYGEQREGLFCGSDHCAVILRLPASLA